MAALCSDDKIQDFLQAMRAGASDQIERLDRLLAEFPQDPRLHFMRGSALIESGRHIEAHQALTRAVAIAPDFAIARFQLGFFELTSGEAENALQTWGRLDRLPDGHYLRKFVDGLRCLIRDDFQGAIDRLREGIALNQENPPMNRDMQLIIDQCLPLLRGDDGAEASTSETSLILGQFKHTRPN